MTVLPQVLLNARVANDSKSQIMDDEDIKAAIEQLEHKLQGKGRVLVRPSGTEPNIRVMIEGEDIKEITKQAERLTELITGRYGV